MNYTMKVKEKTVNTVSLILLIIQPILDVFSFFMVQNEMTMITTMLRMALFALLVVYSFLISDNKKIYIIMCVVLGIFLDFPHDWLFYGWLSVTFPRYGNVCKNNTDADDDVMFYYFFQKGNEIPKMIRTGFFCNYVIITIVILLSYLVGMPESTYGTGIGVKGWFAIGNAQSCIVALLGPLTIYLAIKVKNKLFFVFASLLVFANLFLFGTKVTLYTIFIIIISTVFFLLINKKKDVFIYMFLIGCFVVGILVYKKSPCYQNQYLMGVSFEEWDNDIAKIEEDNRGHKEEDNGDKEGDKNRDEKINYNDYLEIYNLYSKPLVDRFGIEKVVKKYKFSTSAQDLINNRNLKVNYSSLMMDEKNAMIHLFGFEYMDFILDGEIYDPENDFPAIYFSNGIIGLGMYIAFIGYFILLIIRKLLKDFKGSFKLEHGAVAVTLLLILGSAQFSGNVLRRPNVSVYLSLILAYVYYLCMLKKEKQ